MASSCNATESPSPLALAVQYQDRHVGEASDGGRDGRHRARRVLPSYHFGEPAGDMEMFRLESRACSKAWMASGTSPPPSTSSPCAKAQSTRVARGIIPRTTGLVYACPRRRRIPTMPPMHTTVAAVCLWVACCSLLVCMPSPYTRGSVRGWAMSRLARSPWMYGKSPPCTDTGKCVKTTHVQAATSR